MNSTNPFTKTSYDDYFEDLYFSMNVNEKLALTKYIYRIAVDNTIKSLDHIITEGIKTSIALNKPSYYYSINSYTITHQIYKTSLLLVRPSGVINQLSLNTHHLVINKIFTKLPDRWTMHFSALIHFLEPGINNPS